MAPTDDLGDAEMGEPWVTCSRCGRQVIKAEAVGIDGQRVCRQCLHGDAEPFLMYPIGYVRNDLSRAEGGSATKGGGRVSRIELLPTMAPFMVGLAEEKHIIVIYVLHKSQDVRTVFPRGWDGKRVGMFASRTPDRINAIAVTEVRLLGVEGTTLLVEGLDAVDGSPVLDLKMGDAAFRE